MDLPIFNMVFPFKQPTPTLLSGTNLPFNKLARRGDIEIRKHIRRRRVSYKNYSPMVTKSEGEKMNEEDNGNITVVNEPRRKLADAWQDIHGRDDWAGMLDPFDPLLRSELIRYGEMAQACYDAFDYDPFSRYHGNCKYEPSEFFHCLGLTQYGYQVTCYLYATCNFNLPCIFKRSLCHVEQNRANWIGYVAVSNDEASAHLGRRDITIAWRGTVTMLEWVAALMAFLSPMILKKIPCHDPEIKVESGFLHLYTDKDESCQFSDICSRNTVSSRMHFHLGEVHGRGQRFVLANQRDIAMVNKSSDFLKDHLLVPPNWWERENKWLV